MNEVKNFINGEYRASSGGKTFVNEAFLGVVS